MDLQNFYFEVNVVLLPNGINFAFPGTFVSD